MKRHKALSDLPISQRHIADYLGVSVSLLSMTKTGRYGNRELSPAVSGKMMKLLEAHRLAEKANSESRVVATIPDVSPREYSQFAKDMLEEAEFFDMQAKKLTRRLDKMVMAAAEGERWIRTLELLLAPLPDVKEPGKDRQWLEAQKAFAITSLQKNGWLAQVELETQIETKKAMAGIYHAGQKKLLSRLK